MTRSTRRRAGGPGSPGAPAIPLGLRGGAFLVAASLLGLVAFGWPLLVQPAETGADLAHAGDAPWIFVLLLPLLLCVVLAEVAEGSLDAKAVAVLGVLAACGAALRLPGTGVVGFEPMFFLFIPAGRVFGRGFGFVLGALTMFLSALVTGGVGPWLPFQMFGAAWVGFGAGCLPPLRGRLELALLTAYAVVASLVFGVLLNFWFWPFGISAETSLSFVPGDAVVDNLSRFLAFHLATSLGWDLPRAATNAVLMAVAGPAVLATLRRASRRASFAPAVAFEAPPRLAGEATTEA